MNCQNSQIRENFASSAKVPIFSLWTVKLFFFIFGRLSYSFIGHKSNLSVQQVYIRQKPKTDATFKNQLDWRLKHYSNQFSFGPSTNA